MLAYIHSVQSEWLKRKNSAATWLTVLGAALVPLIVLCYRFYYFELMAGQNASADIWEQLYNRSWQYMGFLLLPMGVILTTSLITQIETRSNAWKLLHVTPQRLTTIFFAKLTVILIMLLSFFLLFNIGIYLTGVLPALLVKEVPFPTAPFPWLKYLYGNGTFLLACLPIVAFQYLIGLRYRNFMAPLGVGLGLYIVSFIAFKWEYAYFIPYIYSILTFIDGMHHTVRPVNIYLLSTSYFVGFTVLAYTLYINKRERG